MIFATTVVLAASIVLLVLGVNFVMTSPLITIRGKRARSMSEFHDSLSGAQCPSYEYYS